MATYVKLLIVPMNELTYSAREGQKIRFSRYNLKKNQYMASLV